MVKRALFRYVAAGLADYDTQLGLVVATPILSTMGNVDHGRVRTNQGGSRLVEQSGSFGQYLICFLLK